jgi:hypothetical protein
VSGINAGLREAERGELATGDLTVVEGHGAVGELLPGLVALAGDQHDVAGCSAGQRGRMASAPVGLDDHLRRGAGVDRGPRPALHRVEDRGRVLRAGVVGGEYRPVGEGGRGPHRAPLLAVAVAAAAEHDVHPAAGSDGGTQRLEHLVTASGEWA